MSKKPFLFTLILCCIVFLSLAFRRDDPRYKNLKVLPKDITEQQMDSVMNHFTSALNIGCDFCHVENAAKTDMDWASDENKHKLIARDMMRMTDEINDKFFNYTGEKRTITTKLMVTCFTCHNGKKMPATIPD